MSGIYILAGAPGTGKSTAGFQYIQPELDILNEDDTRLKYKNIGYPDYEHYAMTRVRGIIRNKLINDEDFALELNLGYAHQWEYVLSAKNFRQENELHVVLFHTDSLELCLDRARSRHQSGLHYVAPGTVAQMYDNTLQLLRDNMIHVDSLLLINATITGRNDTVAYYERATAKLDVYDHSALWFNNHLYTFLQSEADKRSLNDTRRSSEGNQPYQPDDDNERDRRRLRRGR